MNEREQYGEGYVEEVIAISRKRVLVFFSFSFCRRSVPNPCVCTRVCARVLCVRAHVCVKCKKESVSATERERKSHSCGFRWRFKLFFLLSGVYDPPCYVFLLRQSFF